MNQNIQLSEIRSFLLNASAKSLATNGPEGLNVVPVSTIKITDNNQIILVDYFFGKTRSNLQNSTTSSLVAWQDTIGFQIKSHHQYQTSGTIFDTVSQWVQQNFPERTVHGIVVLEPQAIFDISLPEN
ncbi:hypothetical protein CSB37_02570 [bacterium DOLZORAL124_38_8]|nr:MAG: hypothetical protein CSB37_02570 [bacterium DOLZORAL124_38_8]